MTIVPRSVLSAALCVAASVGWAGAQPDQRTGRERPVEVEPEPEPEPEAATEPAAGTDDLGDIPSESLVVVPFASGSARLTDDARAHLADVVRWMEQHPWRLMIVEGHTDQIGSRQRNLELSQRRTDVVRDEMIRLGADPRRLVAAAFGELEPEEDRAASRRVVVRATVHTYEELIRAQRVPRLDREDGTPPGQPAPSPAPTTSPEAAAAPAQPAPAQATDDNS